MRSSGFPASDPEPGETPSGCGPAVPRWAGAAAAAARWPLWIGYAASALFYLVRIREAMGAARGAASPPLLFGTSGWASEIFFLVGTAHWVAVGINRIASPVRAAASMVLAGLHILLFAVRVYLGPLLWFMGATGR